MDISIMDRFALRPKPKTPKMDICFVYDTMQYQLIGTIKALDMAQFYIRCGKVYQRHLINYTTTYEKLYEVVKLNKNLKPLYVETLLEPFKRSHIRIYGV